MFFSSVFAPAVRSTPTASTWPAREASMRGVSPFCAGEGGHKRRSSVTTRGSCASLPCVRARRGPRAPGEPLAHNVPGVLRRAPLQQALQARCAPAPRSGVQGSAPRAVLRVGPQPLLLQEREDEHVVAPGGGDVQGRVPVLRVPQGGGSD